MLLGEEENRLPGYSSRESILRIVFFSPLSVSFLSFPLVSKGILLLGSRAVMLCHLHMCGGGNEVAILCRPMCNSLIKSYFNAFSWCFPLNLPFVFNQYSVTEIPHIVLFGIHDLFLSEQHSSGNKDKFRIIRGPKIEPWGTPRDRAVRRCGFLKLLHESRLGLHKKWQFVLFRLARTFLKSKHVHISAYKWQAMWRVYKAM